MTNRRSLWLALAIGALPALAAAAGPAYHAPKNVWGQPDLQGTYTTATITPLTRDPKFGTRNVLTKQEADARTLKDKKKKD